MATTTVQKELLPAADTNGQGAVELATASETLTGTDAVRALTAAGFAGNKSLASSGYYKLPGGLIIQWGSSSVNSGGTSAITWPTAFSTACDVVVAIDVNDAVRTYSDHASRTTSGVTLYCSVAVSTTVMWVAIGR